jgi:NAD(P)-dependent dehydrogenase (short-subunit alcohol dehydrogenase family)
VELGLREKVCVVSGSTAGIGRAVARLLAEEGASVVTSGRRGDGPGVGEALHVAGDLAAPAGAEALIERSLAAFGRVDCLVNNVGYAEIRRFEDVTDAQWDEMWQLNVMSTIRAIRAVLL